MAQFSGVVKWFNNAKGSGFLGREQGPDVSVRYLPIQTDRHRGLKKSAPGDFDEVDGTKGSRAHQVKRPAKP